MAATPGSACASRFTTQAARVGLRSAVISRADLPVAGRTSRGGEFLAAPGEVLGESRVQLGDGPGD